MITRIFNLISFSKAPKIGHGITAVSATGLGLANYNTYMNNKRAKKAEEDAPPR